MNGTTRTSEVSLSTEANLDWNITGAGDFDGNGKAVAEVTNREWNIEIYV